MCVYVCVMDSLMNLNSLVKDMNCWTTKTSDLFVVVKVCVETAIFLR